MSTTFTNLSVEKECPITINLEPSSESIVKGCPGIPRSVPRIETIVQVRSKTGYPFKIRSCASCLITTQKVNVSSKIHLGSSSKNDVYKEFKIYEDPMAFKSVSKDKNHEFSNDCLGVDIPLLIPLPRDVISTGHSQTYNSTTVHHLIFRVYIGDSAVSELMFYEKFPVIIKLYDSLPIYRQFNEPLIESKQSVDHQVIIEARLDQTAIGPGDDLQIKCVIKTNSLNNKLKKNLVLKQISFQVKEILECYDGGLSPRREEIIYSNVAKPNCELNSLGTKQTFNFTKSDYYQNFTMLSNPSPSLNEETNLEDYQTTVIESVNISNVKNFSKLPEGLCLSHNQSFSTVGKLYSIKFELSLKLKFNSKTKDFSMELPITVSPFDQITSGCLLNWILNQCQVAKNRFGKFFIDSYYNAPFQDQVSMISRYRKSPYVYNVTRNEWIELGYNGESFGNLNKKIVSYID